MPDASAIDSVSNVGSMGLLAVITLGVLYLVPQAIKAYREERENDREARSEADTLSRNQTAEILKGIQLDRHDDRNSRHADNLAWQAEFKEQRLRDEAKWERILSQMAEERKQSVEGHRLLSEALHRIEEGNSNIAAAIREIGKHA